MSLELGPILQNVFVRAPMKAIDKDSAIDELCSIIADRCALAEHASRLSNAVRRRGLIGGPSVREGVVFAHGSSPLLGRPVLAIGKLSHSIDWDTGSRAKMVCLLLAPEGFGLDPLLVQLAKVLNNEAITQRFNQCASEHDFQDFFRRVGRNLDVPDGFVLKMPLPPVQQERIQSIAWAPKRPILALVSTHHTNTIVLWNETDDSIVSLSGHQQNIWDLTWSPDGERLLTGAMDSTVRIWKLLPSAQLEKTIDIHANVHGVAWSPDNTTVAVARHLGGVQVFDASGWTTKPTLQGMTVEPAYRVAWSPDGDLLAAVGGRGQAAIQLWDGRSPKTIARLRCRVGPVVAICWSPSSDLLAAGDAGGTIEIWQRGKWVASHTRIKAHNGQITSISFSFDGEYLASKGEDGRVILWKTHDWREVACLLDPTTVSWWSPLAFHPTRLSLATLGGNGDSVRIWDINGETLKKNLSSRGSGVSVQARSLLKLPPTMIEAVRKKGAVLFAGAGMSLDAMPARTESLIEDLESEIRKYYDSYYADGRPFEVVADEYEAILGADSLTTRLVSNIPQDSEATDSHCIAARLFNTVITTNWDLLFEKAFQKGGRFPRVLSTNEDAKEYRSDQPSIIKMHGSADRPTTLVTTSSQYESYHLSHPELLKLIERILGDHVVIFVGYGLRDEHLRRLLATSRFGNKRWTKNAFAIGHYDTFRTAVLNHRDIGVIDCDAATYFASLDQAVGELG